MLVLCFGGRWHLLVFASKEARVGRVVSLVLRNDEFPDPDFRR